MPCVVHDNPILNFAEIWLRPLLLTSKIIGLHWWLFHVSGDLKRSETCKGSFYAVLMLFSCTFVDHFKLIHSYKIYFRSSHKRKFRHCNIGSQEDTRQASLKLKTLDIYRRFHLVENNPWTFYSVPVVSFFFINNSKHFNTSNRPESPYRRRLHLQWNTTLPFVIKRGPPKPKIKPWWYFSNKALTDDSFLLSNRSRWSTDSARNEHRHPHGTCSSA